MRIAGRTTTPLANPSCSTYFGGVKNATIAVRLTPELKGFVEGKVRTGRYQDSSEVVREALRLLEQGEDRREDPALEQLIQEGLNSGPPKPLNRRTWEQIWEESDRLVRPLRRRQKRAA
jgi:antitoxin ParD1/3/4